MVNLKRPLLLVIIVSTGILGLHLNAQGRLEIGISTQLHNTRLMVDLTTSKVKGAYRPAEVLFAQYGLGRHLALHSGLGYAMMTQNSDAFKNNFHYLALPVHMKIGRLKEYQRLAFTSFIGLDMHYLIGANRISPDGDKTDIVEYAQKIHSDMTGGAGVKFRLTERIALEGLVSISYGSNINSYNAALMDITNFNTGFRLNLSFKL